jgi:hypothetical protein
MYPLKTNKSLNKHSTVFWNHAAIAGLHDIRQWCEIASKNARLFELPFEIAFLLNKASDDETDEEQAARQRSSADVVSYCDASTLHRSLGLYIPPVQGRHHGAWAQITFPIDFVVFDESDGSLQPPSINMLELAAFVLSSSLAIHLANTCNLSPSNLPQCLHIHRTGDSQVALHQSASYKANRAFSRSLLLVDTQVQATSPHIFTREHWDGVKNKVADPISRLFTNDLDHSVQNLLATIPRYQLSNDFMPSLQRLARLSTTQHWSMKQMAATTSTIARSWTSATSTN